MSTYDREAIIRDYVNGQSLPDLHQKYGISITYARKILVKAKVMRTVSEAVLLKLSGQEVWRKIICMGSKKRKCTYSTRLVSIPYHYLEGLGFSKTEILLGKWVFGDSEGELVLRIKRESEVNINDC